MRRPKLIDLVVRGRTISCLDGRPCRPRFVPLIVAVAASMLGFGCQGSSAEELTRWRQASAAYDSTLRAWLRDSAVVDSVSRTFTLDSMYALHRTMLRHPRPADVMQEIACERWRTTMRYGVRPSIIAERRMMDTVWRPGESEDIRRMNQRMPGMIATRVGPSRCGGEVKPVVPDTVDGVSMTYSGPRPIPPRRPR